MGSIFLSDGQSSVSEFLIPPNQNSTDAEYQRILKLIDEANPKISDPLQCSIPDEPIYVPSSGHSLEPADKLNYEIFRDSYRTTTPDVKQLLKDVAEDCQQFYELIALSEWATETFSGYSTVSGAADFNTGIGGVGAMIDSRGNKILEHLKKLDALLVQYANAPVSQKGLLKQKIKLAYGDLHGRFGNELGKMVGKIKPHTKQSPLINPNNAMKIATGKSSGARTIPLTGAKETRNLMRFLKNARVVGRGIVAVDLGFRLNNVRNAPTFESKIRTTTVEATGFAFSAGATLMVGKALAPLILVNPVVGVILLLVVGATAAISGDYLGKFVGGKAWDSAYSFGQTLAY